MLALPERMEIKTDSKNIVDRSNLSIKTYYMIKNLILSKDIKDKINLDEIAERLGVSRTPVMSAVAKLESEGFLANTPYKGYFIKKHSEKEFKEILEIRVLFESLGIEKLINDSTEKDFKQIDRFLKKFKIYHENKDTGKYRELDILFHKFIVNETRNDTIIKQYNDFIIVPSLLNTFLTPDESIKDHIKLIGSIIGSDITGAKKIIKNHIGALI